MPTEALRQTLAARKQFIRKVRTEEGRRVRTEELADDSGGAPQCDDVLGRRPGRHSGLLSSLLLSRSSPRIRRRGQLLGNGNGREGEKQRLVRRGGAVRCGNGRSRGLVGPFRSVFERIDRLWWVDGCVRTVVDGCGGF